MHFFCQKICAYQKKAVLLQAFSSEMARLSAFALRTEAARISSSPQKSADFRGPRKGVARLSAFALRTEAARLIGKALAQMAESVDALVSNTSGAIRAGSTPALGTSRELRRSAFALRTEAPYSRSFSQKSADFWGPQREEAADN